MDGTSVSSAKSLRDAIFVIARDSLDNFFSNNPENKTCKFVITYISSSLKNRCHTTSKTYKDIVKLLNNDIIAQTYIDSILVNGAQFVGEGTFGEENKDVIFLAGYLAYLNRANNKKIIVITESDSKLVAETNSGKYGDVTAQLGKIGLKKMDCYVYNPTELKTVISYEDASFAKRYPNI